MKSVNIEEKRDCRRIQRSLQRLKIEANSNEPKAIPPISATEGSGTGVNVNCVTAPTESIMKSAVVAFTSRLISLELVPSRTASTEGGLVNMGTDAPE